MKTSMSNSHMLAVALVLGSVLHNKLVLAEGCTAPGFEAAVKYDAGSTPSSVAVSDFNGDGQLDLAVTDSGSTNVSVLLGNSDGTFWTAASYGVGSNPSFVVVSDFNRDGKPDVAVANRNSASVSVLLGNGDGTFLPAVSYGSPNPTSLAVGDFNADGNPDLAVANWQNGTVSVLLGNGDGTFQPGVAYRSGVESFTSLSYVVAAGDFNGDGVLDLALGTWGTLRHAIGATISVLLGNGDGTFQPAIVNHTYGLEPVSIAVNDFTGDGKLDMAVANDGNGFLVLVLAGNGDGTFYTTNGYTAETYSHSVTSGDFNADGKADLAVAVSGTSDQNYTNAGVSVLLGNGDGSFQTGVLFNVQGSPASVAVGDFNGDGQPDLVVAGSGTYEQNYTDAGVSVLLNTCGSTANESGPPPEVKVVATDPNASEAALDSGTFTISRAGDTNSDLTVFFTLGGNATSGSDYQPIGDSVTIPPGAVSADIVVQPIDDTEVEGSETVVLTLSTNAAYTIDQGGSSATVTIADNDEVATDPTIHPGHLFVSESGSGNIYQVAPDGTRSTFATGMSNLWGLAFGTDGNLFAANNE